MRRRRKPDKRTECQGHLCLLIGRSCPVRAGAARLLWALCEPTGEPDDRRPDHPEQAGHRRRKKTHGDRKSTRLKSSHVRISYAVFCLKKKKKTKKTNHQV